MVKTVVWSENATKDLALVLFYLRYKWSQQVAQNFLQLLDERIELIKRTPKVGIKSSKYKNVFRILVTKHNALYYQVDNDCIEILNLFDTRQNPKKDIYK